MSFLDVNKDHDLDEQFSFSGRTLYHTAMVERQVLSPNTILPWLQPTTLTDLRYPPVELAAGGRVPDTERWRRSNELLQNVNDR